MRTALFLAPCLLPALSLGLAAPDETAWDPTVYRGAAVQGAGDCNADGFPEIVIGSFTERKVWVFSAKKGKLLYTIKGKKGDFGWAVDGAGDTNQDGHSEIVVGSPATDTVTVYKGRKGKELSKIEGVEGERFGWAVAGVGDTNGNGFSEIVVASRGKGIDLPGSARVYSARDGELLLNLTDGVDGACDVYAVNGAGDTNSDGFRDVIVGLPFNGNGTVQVHSGKDGKVLLSLSGEAAGQGFGMAVATAGDVDADGFADIVVGAPFGGAGTGEIAVFSGKNGEELFKVKGEVLGERFGFSVAGVGDVNLDGRSDVIVGAPGPPRDLQQGPIAAMLEQMSDEALNRIATRGRAVVFSGRGGQVLHEVSSETENDWFGINVSGLGDADGDGRADFCVGLDILGKKDKRGAEAHAYAGKDKERLHAFADGKRLKD